MRKLGLLVLCFAFVGCGSGKMKTVGSTGGGGDGEMMGAGGEMMPGEMMPGGGGGGTMTPTSVPGVEFKLDRFTVPAGSEMFMCRYFPPGQAELFISGM